MKYNCDYCGESFRRTPNQVTGKHKFCSRKCSIAFFRENGKLKAFGAVSSASIKLRNIVAIKKMFGDING